MKTSAHQTFAELVGFPPPSWTQGSSEALQAHGTTVLALRFDDGVVVLGDRRATAGNLVMYDQAEKIVAIDDFTLLALSGSFARSVESARFLKHSFKYYRRLTLGQLSLDGKLQEISRVMASNFEMAMQGIGVFLPIVAAYDAESDSFQLYFFDGAGARFQNHAYACAGSGSERIRGVFEYLTRTKGPWDSRPLDEVLSDGLIMLDIASELDSATGGFRRVLPTARILDREGVHPIPDDRLAAAAKAVLGQNAANS